MKWSDPSQRTARREAASQRAQIEEQARALLKRGNLQEVVALLAENADLRRRLATEKARLDALYRRLEEKT